MATSVGYNSRDPRIDSTPWFSDELTEQVKLSVTKLCLTKITSARDHTLINNSESGLLTKGIVYLTTEIAFILLVPVALIESAFRFAIGCLAYPLAATDVISDDEDDFYVRVLKTSPIKTAISGLEAFHSTFLGLNPTKEIGNAMESIDSHFPLLGTFAKALLDSN